MFTWTKKDAERKFPAAVIFQSRFRGAKHFSGGRISAKEKLLEETREDDPYTELGVAMRDVFRCTWSSQKDHASCDGVIDKALEVIKRERGIRDVEEQYEACKKLAEERDCIKLYPYDKVVAYSELGCLWGISQQMRFGLLLREILWKHMNYKMKLDPVFGCLLNPTGGVLGTPPLWIHRVCAWQDGPLPYERICKDTVWYLKTYHNFDVSTHGKYTGTITWYWVFAVIQKMPMWY